MPTQNGGLQPIITPKRIGMIVAGFILLIMIIMMWPFHTVPTGYRGIVTQFGAIQRIEGEGLVILPPWQRLAIFNIRSEAATIENAEGATSDTQPVKVSLTVRYAIRTDRIAEVYEKYSHDGDLSSYVQTATQEVFKAVTARYSAPDLIAKRAQVSSEINTALGAKLASYGAMVVNIDMRNFSFSPDYMEAISKKVKQDQFLQTAEKEALTAAADQKKKVVTAEAEAHAQKVKADAEAYSQLTIAKAKAEAMRVQAAAIQASKDILELKRIEVELEKAERWNGALPTHVYGSAPVPFMQVQPSK